MDATVYADVLFLINFLINFILLKITEMFSKRKMTALRLCLAAAFGAAYAVFMFLPQLEILYIFPFKMIVSLIMVLIAYPKSGSVQTVKCCAVFYLVSFSFAGILLALIYFTDFAKNTSPKLYDGIFYFDISLTTLIVSSFVSYVVLMLASSIFSRNRNLGIRNLKICVDGKECTLTALSDTGNLLTDPISNSSVIIAERNHILPLFPEGIPSINEPRVSCSRLRIIPYSSLGNESGIMTGFVPDEIIIDGRKIHDTIVGISETVLSKTNEYNALFNPNIINNRRSQKPCKY